MTDEKIMATIKPDGEYWQPEIETECVFSKTGIKKRRKIHSEHKLYNR